MRVTVTQWQGAGDQEAQWTSLIDHCRRNRPDLVLLPELPFSSWLPGREVVDEAAYQAAVEAHQGIEGSLNQLASSLVLYTRPILDAGVRRHQAWLHSTESHKPIAYQCKTALPDEPGWRESRWFTPGKTPPESHHAIYTHLEVTRIGVLICSELWMDHNRRLGMEGARILLSPRATADGNYDRWLMAGRMAAIQAAAYSLSSNRAGVDEGVEFGGKGWIVSPEGDLLAETSNDEPIVTLELDLLATEHARYEYPRTLYMRPDEKRKAFL